MMGEGSDPSPILFRCDAEAALSHKERGLTLCKYTFASALNHL